MFGFLPVKDNTSESTWTVEAIFTLVCLRRAAVIQAHDQHFQTCMCDAALEKLKQVYYPIAFLDYPIKVTKTVNHIGVV